MSDDGRPLHPIEQLWAVEDEIATWHGRSSRRAAFEIGIERVDEYFEVTELSADRTTPVLVEDYVDGALVAELRDLAGEVAVEDADSGRGSSGYAAALELVGYVADIGGAGAAITAGAHVVRAVYRRITQRAGAPPLVSLGAAIHLAAADLIDRVGPDFRLLGAHDAADRPPDFSYTGEDQFIVLFHRQREMFTYLVEADGVVHFIGQVKRAATPMEQAMREIEVERE